MNALLWILQALGALLYSASGAMKIFMRNVWLSLGILELVCVVGLILPAALRWQPNLTAVAAIALALESLVFIAVHVKCGRSCLSS